MYQYIKYKKSYFVYSVSEDILIRKNRKILNLEFELVQTIKEPVLNMMTSSPYTFKAIPIDDSLEEYVKKFIVTDLYEELVETEEVTNENDLKEIEIKLQQVCKTAINTLEKILRKECLI